MDTNQYIAIFVAIGLAFSIGLLVPTPVNWDMSESPKNSTNNASEDTNNPSEDGNVATVVEVSDGDTIDVRYDNGAKETVRIFGIDSPEKDTELSGTSEFGVQSTEKGVSCLDEHAQEATNFAEEKLQDKRVEILQTSGENRGDFGRQLRYVVPNGSDKKYGEMILEEGLARIYDDQGPFDELGSYESIEDVAKTSKVGLWDCSVHKSGIGIFEVRSDSEGSDTENLTEFVEIGNTGSTPVQLDDFTVSDESGKSLDLPSRSLGVNETVEIHTCEAIDNNSIVFDTCSAVWNNNGDSVILNSSDVDIKLTYD